MSKTLVPYQGKYVSITPYFAMKDTTEQFWRISKVSINPIDSSFILTYVQQNAAKWSNSDDYDMIVGILQELIKSDIEANQLYKALVQTKTDI